MVLMSTLRKVRYAFAKTAVRAPLVWVRHRNFRPGDVFVGSYPRSGSTWLRFMLLEILAGQASGFSNTNEMLPDVGKHQSGAPVLPGNGRLIKTHEPFRAEYRKAIFLVRDPRDVALSEFAFHRALGLAGDDFDSYLEHFSTRKRQSLRLLDQPHQFLARCRRFRPRPDSARELRATQAQAAARN